jgi:hypothetical protein
LGTEIALRSTQQFRDLISILVANGALQAIFVKPGSGGLGAIPPRCKDPFEHVSLGAAALTKQVHLCWLAALTFRETAE